MNLKKFFDAVSFARSFVIAVLVFIIYRLLVMTWRVTRFEPPELQVALKKGTGAVFAHWHGDELVLISLIRKYNIATMVSTSSDGQIMNWVIRFLGGKTSRGSSTRRGASALLGLVRYIRSGKNASMAVDGPKGPLHVVKPGVFHLSQLVNMPIFVGGVYCDRAFRFERSWNKTYLPKPFARVFIVWEKGSEPPKRCSEDDLTTKGLALAKALNIVQQNAAKHIAPCKA